MQVRSYIKATYKILIINTAKSAKNCSVFSPKTTLKTAKLTIGKDLMRSFRSSLLDF